MAIVPFALTRPFLFGLDPERAHELTLDAIAALQNTPAQCVWSQRRIDDPLTLVGLRFPNRVGLAAGLDKNGRCIDGFGAMGFGFIEVGTVTPLGQPGKRQRVGDAALRPDALRGGVLQRRDGVQRQLMGALGIEAEEERAGQGKGDDGHN